MPIQRITSGIIAEGSITAGDVADGTITAVKLAPGAALPSQSGSGTYYLTTDGSNATWVAQSAIAITGTNTQSLLDSLQDNLGLIQVRQITDGGFAFRGMSAGVSDSFEDLTGVADTINVSFSSSLDKFTANTGHIESSSTPGGSVTTELGDNTSKTGWAGETGSFTFNSPSTNKITSGTTGGGSNERLNLARQVDITGAFDLVFKVQNAANIGGWVGIYRASDESHIDTVNNNLNRYGAGMFSSSSGHWINGDPASTVGYLVQLSGTTAAYGYNVKGASSTTVTGLSASSVHKISREAGGAIKYYVDDVLKATSTTSTTAAMRVVIGAAGEGQYLYLDYLQIQTSSAPVITYFPANTEIITKETSAASTPSKARVVLLAAPNESITLNTDLIASVSRDNGTTFSAVTLSDSGSYAGSGNVKIYTGEADLGGQPSGNTIKTKIQTVMKNVEIQGYTTQWN